MLEWNDDEWRSPSFVQWVRDEINSVLQGLKGDTKLIDVCVGTHPPGVRVVAFNDTTSCTSVTVEADIHDTGHSITLRIPMQLNCLTSERGTIGAKGRRRMGMLDSDESLLLPVQVHLSQLDAHVRATVVYNSSEDGCTQVCVEKVDVNSLQVNTSFDGSPPGPVVAHSVRERLVGVATSLQGQSYHM